MSPNSVYFFLYFFSGAVGLIYETVWVRLFVISFGSTAVAVGGVLAAYMLGLAIGGFGGGIFADRSRASMIRVYAVLELFVMVFALLAPTMIRSLEPGNGIGTVTGEFIFSLMFILLPTTLMGAAYPVMSRAISSLAKEFGELAGKLYAVNLFGAATGCFITGFFLLPGLGLKYTVFLGAMLNLLVVLGAYAAPSGEHAPAVSSVAVEKKKKRMLPLIVALGTGFSGMSYEVIYTRILALIVHNTVYAFTSMLTVFLLGSFIGSRTSSLWACHERRRWHFLGLAEVAAGFYAMASISWASSLADWFLELNYSSQIFGESFIAFLGGQFALATMLILVPSFLLGFTFPLCVGIYHSDSDLKTAGRSAGMIYSINTLGAVVGAGGCGLYFIPHLGTRWVLLLAGGVNILLGTTVILTNRKADMKKRIGGAVLVVFMCFVLSPLTYYDLTFTSLAAGPEIEVVFREEDTSALIEVFRERENGVLALISNRQQQEGSTSALSLYSQKKQGYLPLLLHPSPGKVLGIGLGTGISYRPWTIFPLKSAEIVEISPGVIHAAEVFGSYNGNIVHRSNIKIIQADGRTVLRGGDILYDLIVADLFSPYREGTGNLYTVEHYRRCRKKLQRGGMMWQWLPPHQLPVEALLSIINSFTAVFPHSTLWVTRQSMALQGGLKPLSISWPQLVKNIQLPAVKADLALDNLDDPLEFLSLFFAGEESLQKLPSPLPENTEDNAAVEFFTPRYLHLLPEEKLYFSNLEQLLPLKESIRPYLGGWNGDDDELEKREAAKAHVYRGRILKAGGDPIQATAEFLKALELHPAEMEALRERDQPR